MICRYCMRDFVLPCQNTRDMEDSAIAGDAVCYTSLAAAGGGEKGMAYVTANRAKNLPKTNPRPIVHGPTPATWD